MNIKGVNLGGWLMMEGYILGGRNIPEKEFKKNFKKINGEVELKDFENKFRENFIKKDDFKNISLICANTIRLPFNYRIIENNIEYLEKALDLAEEYNLKVILDLHAAIGSQNKDWHSDSAGEALLWKDKKYRLHTYKNWEFLADKFRNKKSLLGYDILNEPVLEDRSILKNFYSDLIKIIKKIDKSHIIFLEGNIWAQEIDFLKDLIEENVWISIHSYQPLNYVFNFVPLYKYPGKIDGVFWDKKRLYNYLKPYYIFSKKHNVKIYVGEFGINWRGGVFGEVDYLKDLLDIFEEFGFGYTYWTYKAVATYNFPNGIYQYLPNTKYISREGPIFGWENYIYNWKEKKEEIISFWDTSKFNPVKELIEVLKKYFKINDCPCHLNKR